MLPFEAYTLHLAIKKHFTTKNYDFFKWNGRIKAEPEKFERNQLKVFFAKMAKHEDLQNFLIANIIHNPKVSARDLAYAEECETVYKEWRKRQQSLTYLFRQDLAKLKGTFDSNLLTEEGQHPTLIRKFLAKEISLETVCLIVALTGVLKYWDKAMKEDVLYNNIRPLLVKYLPFIQHDKEKLKQIIIDTFE